MESGASPLDGTRNEHEDVRLWAAKSTQVLNQCQMSEFRLEGRNLATQERQVTQNFCDATRLDCIATSDRRLSIVLQVVLCCPGHVRRSVV